MCKNELIKIFSLGKTSAPSSPKSKFLAAAYGIPPQRALHMLASWWLRPKAAVQFLHTYFPEAKVLIFGHFHLHNRWQRGGRLIIDTGSYLNPGKARWVEWHNGWLRRGPVIESPGAFRIGEALDAWRLP